MKLAHINLNIEHVESGTMDISAAECSRQRQ